VSEPALEVRHSGDVESVLFRGRPLRLRELRATDRAGIEALLAQVAPPDLQMRFFGLFHRVPPALLDELMRIEPAQCLTVAAVRDSDSRDDVAEILAVARAHRTAGACAEAALLVRSDLKGEGLGSMLLGTLIAQCRDWGLSRIMAEVMRRNSRMLRLAKKYGFRCESVHEDTCQLVLDLTSHV
jgi:acetyltransferase